MTKELLDTIRSANCEFGEFINQVLPDGAKAEETRSAILRLGKVNLRLQHVSKCLAAVPPPGAEAEEAAHQALQYRENLQALKGIVESLQVSLLAKKACLDNVRANARAAGAWAASMRQIS